MNPHGPHGGHGPHSHGPHSHGPHHYQPYPDLSSPSPVPHSPASHGADTSPFNGHPGSGGGNGTGGGNGAGGGNGGGNPHQHHLQVSMDTHHGGHMGGGPGHHHQLHNHHHHINNNNNSTNNNNKNNNNGGHACAGCGGKILERYLLHALDRYWHHSCLKCTCCAGQLADLGTSCFTKSGMILCKADYARLFGNTGACSACGQTIPASEFVMRVGGGPGVGTPSAPSPLHVFHLKCFSCSKCGSQLVPGDRYHLLGGALVCEQDWHKLIKGGGAAGVPGAAGPGATPGVRKGKVGRPRRSRD